jgi:predicted RecB family nuclease
LSLREFVVKYFDKDYEKLSLQRLRDSPVSAISGVSESDAANLQKTFGIKTVGDLATNRYVLLAQAINAFSRFSGKVLDKEFESSEFEKLREKPVSAISGISESDAALLKKAFGIDTIAELAENKYVQIAQLTTIPVSMIEFLAAANS